MKGLDALRQVGHLFMNSPVVEGLKSFFEGVTDTITSIAKLVLAPAFDRLKTVLGAAWDAIKEIGTTIWGWLKAVKDAVGAAFDWVAQQLGFDSASGEGGLTDWIAKKAGEVWESIKETIQPIIGPLKVIGATLALLTGVGEIYLVIKYAPKVVEAVQWLWAHKDDPDIVKSAHAQMGGTILPDLLDAGSGLLNTIESAISGFLGKLTSLATGFLQLLGAITGVPLLSMAQSFVETVSQGLNSAVAWATYFVGKAVASIKSGLSRLYAFCEPYIEVLLSIATAIADPPMIPVILAGWAWRALPDCIKPPIIDLLLDAVISILDGPARLRDVRAALADHQERRDRLPGGPARALAEGQDRRSPTSSPRS